MPWNDRFLRACRGQPVDVTPVWFMRQAGRYQPEYRALRERYTLLEICEAPELCAWVTALPVRQLGVDAAILFSDIMIPLRAVGIEVAIEENRGPVIACPLRREADLERLRPLEAEEDVPYVLETIRGLRRELPVPLLGFAGAPFTLASYLVEGGPSRRFLKTKELMYREPGLWHRLMERLAAIVATYLRAQVEAGVHAVQLFDSWAGALSPADYREFVLPHTRAVLQALDGTGVPRILFGVETAGLLPAMAGAGCEVLGLDWRVSIGEVRRSLGPGVPVQGNLDPATLLGPWEQARKRAGEILDEASGMPGHIFNLGHGVLPGTPVDSLRRLVDYVHGYRGA